MDLIGFCLTEPLKYYKLQIPHQNMYSTMDPHIVQMFSEMLKMMTQHV